MQLCIILTILLVGYHADAFKVSQKNFTDIITFTYVYGNKDAMMKHEEAMNFCRDLDNRIKAAELIETVTNAPTTTATPSTTTVSSGTTTVSGGQQNLIVRSDLLSIHEPAMVPELMDWIQSVDNHQFWIGGMVKTVQNDFNHGRPHMIHLWTDRTPANFRFIQYPSEELDHLHENEVRCLSVDFSSGKWGVHKCDDEMYFVCETVRLPAEEIGLESTQANTPTTTGPSTTVKA